MSKARQIFAVMAVTTALCADQVAVAAPAPETQAVQIGSLAGRLVNRLSQSFRRVVPAAVPPALPQQKLAAAPRPVRVEAGAIGSVHCTFCVFQFRLPPPLA